MRFLRALFASALLTVCMFLPAKVEAASEQIDSFVSNISINQQNVATITEAIEYNFGSLERHGIKRFVPTKTMAGQTGQHYYYNFEFVEATQDGHKVEVKLSQEGSYQVIRLGDPNATITGVHSYIITYQLSPVLEQDGASNYLNWNITGNDWEVPIMAASASITLPVAETVEASRCYTGPAGSTVQDCQVNASDNQVNTQSLEPLLPGEGLTINVLSSGTVYAHYLAPGNRPLYQILPFAGFVVGGLAVLLGLLGRFVSWLLYKYRRSRQLVIAQYEAPDGLSPGEVGLLNDHRANMVEITATLVDLAVRGYLRIDQTKPKSLFKRAEYTFYKGKSAAAGTRAYERKLLDMLFGSGKKSVALKSLSKTTAAGVVNQVKQDFKKDLEKKGYYVLKRKKAWWRTLRKLVVWVVVLAVLVGNTYAWLKGAEFGVIVFATIVMFVGLVLGWAISQRTEFSQAGYRQWAKVQGLKLFLTVTEKERLKFHNAPAKNPKLFNKLLPYAIALGVEKEWAKQFEGMDLAKDASWYSSRYPFTAIVLADSLSGDLSKGVQSNMSPPSQSSGGYSGGGFSGGGGGGGGGGSW